MGVFAALDVSQDETAVCVVSQDGAILAETKVKTCPDAIADWLSTWVGELERVGMETGPLAVWLWNALAARNLPIAASPNPIRDATAPAIPHPTSHIRDGCVRIAPRCAPHLPRRKGSCNGWTWVCFLR